MSPGRARSPGSCRLGTDTLPEGYAKPYPHRPSELPPACGSQVFDKHEKYQFLLELIFKSRYSVDGLEESDCFHGSERVKAILSDR